MSTSRLAYIDWMRGLACVLMFQTHCYDAWLSPEARQSELFHWSQLGGTFPAPLFLFLAGVSFALVTGKLRQKGIAAAQVARTTILRGAEIFALGLAFRLQEYLLGLPWAPWTDLLRVDILNTIGLSMMLMGVMCRFTPTRASTIAGATGTTLAIALVTPPLWTTWRAMTSKLPWWLESYINGVHTFPEPQPWLFPIFPWTAFAFAGLAAGLLLFDFSSKPEKAKDNAEAQRAQSNAEPTQSQLGQPQRSSANSVALRWILPSDLAQREPRLVAALGISGAALAALAFWLDSLPVQVYAVYDFWHTSPNFFLIRLGLLLVILFGCYAWCRWGLGAWGFSPIVQLGTTSLLVYWVHIQFVYGRFSILEKGAQSVAAASFGLLVIFVAMVLLSLGRTWTKKRVHSRQLTADS